jgi:hypothetical protein
MTSHPTMTFEENCKVRNAYNKFHCQQNKLIPTYGGVKVSKNIFLITEDDIIHTQLNKDKLAPLINGNSLWDDNQEIPNFFDQPTYVDHRRHYNSGFSDFHCFYIGIDSFILPVLAFENHGFDEEAGLLSFNITYHGLAIDEPEFKKALMQLKLILG